MTQPGPLLAIAEAERDAAAEHLRIHREHCTAPATGWDCPDCRSLTGHADRTRRQVALLTAPGETGELFS